MVTKPPARSPLYAALAAAFLGLFAHAAAYATPITRPGDEWSTDPEVDVGVDARWIGKGGEAHPFPGKVSTRWVWELIPTRRADYPVPGPVLKTTVELPVGVEFQRSKRKLLKDAEVSGRSVSVETDSFPIDLRFAGAEGKFRLLINLKSKSDAPYFLLHPECNDVGIAIKELKGAGKFLFASAYCKRIGANVDIYVLSSSSATIDSEDKVKVAYHPTPWYHLYRYFRSDFSRKSKDGKSLSVFEVSSKGSDEPTRHQIVFKGGPSLFSLVPGVGLTYINYQEPVNGISLNELGVTVKISGGYTLFPKSLKKRLKADLTVFFTLVPISLCPLPAARFVGVNTRIGYQFPGKWLGLSWTVLTGGYFWSMLVPSSAFGVGFLLGPQLQIVGRAGGGDERVWYSYFKYAPLSTGGIQLENGEFAVGVGYQLSRPHARRAWNLTGDFSFTNVLLPDGKNGFELGTISVGISTPIF